MNPTFLTIAAAMSVAAASGAQAQDMSGWTPGSEITGHSVQVETMGVTNTIRFQPDGTANIATPGGNVVNARWSATSDQLCLMSGGATECWAYQRPFRAGQQVAMTSNCNVASTWMPISTAQPAVQSRAGERG